MMHGQKNMKSSSNKSLSSSSIQRVWYSV